MSEITENLLHKWLDYDEGEARVFISYSHDDFGPFVERFANDLMKQNVSCWLDKANLTPTVEWEEEIENGIKECDYFLFFMSKLSIRRPDGYCIKEISFAQQCQKVIIPIKIEDIPPLIGFDTVQIIPMLDTFIKNGDEGTIDEKKYAVGLKAILDFVLNKKTITSDNGFQHLYECLKPIPQTHYFQDKKVQGYERIKKELNDWIECDLDKRYYDSIYSTNVICFVAKTGGGKSTFISDYCQSRDDIAGVHFCKTNSGDRSSAKRMLMTLAYSLANRLPEYRMMLNRVPNLDKLESSSTSSVFETLFILPFSKMKERPKNVVFIIDGLDESENHNDGDDITDFIVKTITASNSGLRFIITTRPEEWVLNKINDSKSQIKKIAQTDEEVDESIRLYLMDKLSILVRKGIIKNDKILKHYINIIVQKAGHSFVYATSAAKELLEKDKLTIDDINTLPQGVMHMYYDAFQKIFFSDASKESKYVVTYEQAKEVLKVLVAQYQRLTLSQIAGFLKSNNVTNSTYVLSNTLGLLSSFFSIIRLNQQESEDMSNSGGYGSEIDDNDYNIVEAVHSSLIEWLTSKNSAKFQIALDEAHLMMANHYEIEISEGNLTTYACNFYISHLIGADEYKRAVKYIVDYDFQKKREKVVGKFHAIEDYMKELFMFSQKYKDTRPIYVAEIFESKVFHEYIGEFRKIFYNQNSVYKRLKEAGFGVYTDDYFNKLAEHPGMEIDFNFTAAAIDFLYINELYVKATKYCKQVIANYDNIPSHILVEIYKMLSLSYRKRGNLEMCIKYADKCNELNLQTGQKCNYDVGVVNLILGKTYYHCLEFLKGQKQIELGIEQLLSTISKSETYINDDEDYDDDVIENKSFDDEDYDDDDDDEVVVKKPKQEEQTQGIQTSSYDYYLIIIYYTAAFLRELALLHLWNHDYKQAKESIDKIEELYSRKDYVIDRYYVRYLYAKMLYNILTGKPEDGVNEYSNAIGYAVTAYEKSQVIFITALGYYLLGDIENAQAFINDAITVVEKKKKFEIYEKGEIYILADVINGNIKSMDDFDNEKLFYKLTGMNLQEAKVVDSQYNEYNVNALFNWFNYVAKFILELKNKK